MHIKNDAKGLIVLFAAALFLQPATAQNTTFEKADHGVIVYFANNNLNSTRAVQLEVVSDKIIHVIESPELPLQSDTSLMVIPQNFGVKYSVNSSANDITVSTSMIRAIVSKKSGLVTFKDLEGKDLLSEDDNVKSFTPVAIDAGRSWQIQRSFIATGDAAFYGLGQHQQGTMNYRGNVITLLQNNTEVAIPFLVSNKNYGLLWDNYSISKFTDGRQYESLDQLKLYDADNNAGALSASYVSKNDPQQVTTKRDEKIIAYDYLSDQKDFPSAFPLDKGKVIWTGSIESPFSGVHTFAFRYGGYIKAWINDSLCLDEWRQCWNPKTTFIPFAIQAGQKYAFRMEWKPDGGESYISCNWLRPATAEENKHFILQSEAGDNVNYYFVYGKNADEIIAGYRRLTGKAPIVPDGRLDSGKAVSDIKPRSRLSLLCKRFVKPVSHLIISFLTGNIGDLINGAASNLIHRGFLTRKE